MFLIIDNNCASMVFGDADPAWAEPVRSALFEHRVIAVHGGKLTDEYTRNRRVAEAIVRLDRAGCVRKLPRKPIDEETSRLAALGTLKSDDPHVVAIARVHSDARVLVSDDDALRADFKKKEFVDKPRGKLIFRGTRDVKGVLTKYGHKPRRT